MADQKRWFKVWTSIISDDDFDPARIGGLLGLGRFAMLGAYTALHGTRGTLEVMPDTLLRLTNAANIDELRSELALKNVSFEEGKNRYGKVTVTWEKWLTYQEDSTAKERMKTLRAKRRGEERREEEKRGEEKNTKSILPLSQQSATTVWPESDLWILRFLETQGLLSLPPTALKDPRWWEQVSYTTNGIDLQFLEKEFAKMGAWVGENPRRVPTKDAGWKRFVRGWLERSYERERRLTNGSQNTKYATNTAQ